MDERLRELERLVAVGEDARVELARVRARLGLAPHPVTFDVLGCATPKANKHKVARRGRKRSIVNDLTGVLAKSEESFAERALEAIDLEARAALPWDCPLEAHVVFVYKPTPSWGKWMFEAALRGVFRYVKTPDLENVAKFVFDALEGVFYANDKLIWRQTLEKRYGEEERVIVTLTPTVQATASNWKELTV